MSGLNKHVTLGMAGNRACSFVYCPSVPDHKRAATIREFLELVASSKPGVQAVLDRRLDLRTTVEELRSLAFGLRANGVSSREMQGGGL
jgi:hypothetical protein